MKAVGYMRCSGMSQVQGDTFTRQGEAIEACCVAKGFDLLRLYQEEGIAGKLGEEFRPAFQEMVAELLGNGCRTIIVESLDRLARQYDVQQQLATYLASKGIALIAANTGEDITAALMGDPMRRALVQIQGIFAELDKNMLIAKLRKGLLRNRLKDGLAKGFSEEDAIKNGRCEGRKPYGKLPGEAEVLAEMRRLSESLIPKEVCCMLNQSGYRTRYNKPWHPSTVAKILSR